MKSGLEVSYHWRMDLVSPTRSCSGGLSAMMADGGVDEGYFLTASKTWSSGCYSRKGSGGGRIFFCDYREVVRYRRCKYQFSGCWVKLRNSLCRWEDLESTKSGRRVGEWAWSLSAKITWRLSAGRGLSRNGKSHNSSVRSSQKRNSQHFTMNNFTFL